jgi:hypothetical protein
MLVKFADSALHEIAKVTARWSYNHGDGEGSFWMVRVKSRNDTVGLFAQEVRSTRRK